MAAVIVDSVPVQPHRSKKDGTRDPVTMRTGQSKDDAETREFAPNLIEET
jgi:hypothetical protein